MKVPGDVLLLAHLKAEAKYRLEGLLTDPNIVEEAPQGVVSVVRAVTKLPGGVHGCYMAVTQGMGQG